MKQILVILMAMAMSFTSFAEVNYVNGVEVINHSVESGKFHKSGNLSLTKYEALNDEFRAVISYKLKSKWYVPGMFKKFFKGTYEFSLPESMAVEQGYLDLRDNGPIVVANGDKVATVRYVSQLDLTSFTDVHKIEIRSKSTISPDYPEGKWHMFLYYHPSISSMGIVKTEIYYHGKAGNYELVSNLK